MKADLPTFNSFNKFLLSKFHSLECTFSFKKNAGLVDNFSSFNLSLTPSGTFPWQSYVRLTYVERLSWARDLWPESCRRCRVVAGVEAREHPPSSLEGVEQPSEAIKEKKSSCIYFSGWHYWVVSPLQKKKKSTLYRKKSNILIFNHVPRGQKLFSKCSTINRMVH